MLKADSWSRDLLLLTLLLVLFFGFQLGKRAMWSPDEGRYSEVAREMVVSGDYITPRLNGVKFFDKPPLFYWLQSLSIRTFGVNEWGLRLWPAAFALFSCLAIYAAGRTLFDRRSALIAAVVLATSGLHYALSRIANLDMELSTFLTGALLCFLCGSREPPGPRRRSAVRAFYIFAGLAVLQKGLIGVVIPGLVIGTWILVFDERQMLKSLYLPSGLVLFLAITAPWHVLVATENPEFLNIYFVHEHFHRFLFQAGAPLEGWWTFVPVLLIGLFPWTVFLYPALKHNLDSSLSPRHEKKAAIFLALWGGWVFLFFSLSSSKVIPYILPMFPPIALLIGRYFSAAWRQRNLREIRACCYIQLIALVVATASGLINMQHYFERYSNWPILEVQSDESTIPQNTTTAFSDMVALKPYVMAQSGILLIGALTAISLSRRRGFPAIFGAWTITAALCLMIVNSSLTIFDDRRSVKDLAMALKPQLNLDDEVASYHAYYQDLPLYLQRHVTPIGWTDSFELSDTDRNRQEVSDSELWRKWMNPQSIFVITDRSTYDKLRGTGSRLMYLVAQTRYDVVFSNRQPLSTSAPKVSAF